MTKRLLGLLLVAVATLFVVPTFVTKASAANDEEYDIGAAISYAEDNWDNGRGLCAQFVSECLNSGGVKTSSRRVVNLYNELLEKDYGKSYKLKLTNGKNGSIRMSDNVGKVKKGDPIFFYCNVCETYEHVVLCNGVNSDGYIQDYAHNKPHNGKKRTYTFDHCGSNNWTMYSISIDNGDTLKVPEVKSVKGTAKGVEVKWNTVKFADAYDVYRKVPGGKWSLVKTVKGDNYTDTKAENGNTYVYTVRAVNEKTTSGYKPSKAYKFVDRIKVSAISATPSGVKLTWNKNDSATGYYVYRSVNGGKWTKLATLKGNSKTTYADLSVESGNNYRYRVLGYAGSSIGSYYPNCATINFVSTPELRSIQNTKNGISVKWGNVKGATGYRVYRRAADDKSWICLGTVKGNVYNDKTVTNGTTYKYTVRAECKNSVSCYENGLVIRHIKTPRITSVKRVAKGLALEWESVSDVSGYYIYRKAEGDKQWTRIAVVRDGNTYVDKKVEDGVKYTYTVKAFFGKTMSGYIDGVTCKYIRKNENELGIPEPDDND